MKKNVKDLVIDEGVLNLAKNKKRKTHGHTLIDLM